MKDSNSFSTFSTYTLIQILNYQIKYLNLIGTKSDKKFYKGISKLLRVGDYKQVICCLLKSNLMSNGSYYNAMRVSQLSKFNL